MSGRIVDASLVPATGRRNTEDTERQEAGAEIETRQGREWADLIGAFEVRQVALALDEGRALDGATGEIVSELRGKGGYRGFPVPWEALEVRAGETLAGGVPDPIRTAPIIDRLFPMSVAAMMGGQMVNVPMGDVEFPVTTSGVSASWQATETGAAAAAAAYATTDRPLKPDNTLGIQMRITRKALKQSGTALEQAVRRDMNGAIMQAMDKAAFLAGASGYGIASRAVAAAATWAAFRAEAVAFINGNAAMGPKDVRLLIRPEVWDTMDAALFDTGSGVTEWTRLMDSFGMVVQTNNALAAPSTGANPATSAILTTTAGGVAPFYVGTWGAIDLIRDPYSDAASGALRLTALSTCDVTVSRSVQARVLTGIQ